jgi:ABC-type uncharacterized transport system YnjBCD permease subunit
VAGQRRGVEGESAMTNFAIPGDMALNDDESDCVFIAGLAAVAQQLETGAQVIAGSWSYDRNAGIDIDNIFVKDPDLRLVRLAFFDYLVSVPDVVGVVSVNLRVDNATRTLYVTFEVATDFGPLQKTLALQFPSS